MIEAPPKVIIELGRSPIQGVGVFAVSDIKRGEKIADGVAEQDYRDLITWSDFGSLDEDVRAKIMDFCIGTPEGFIPPENLDFNKLSIEWYLNHSCEGNCGFSDDGDFVAIRDIEREEELTYDYGLAESNPNFLMECNCESLNCRRVVTGNDWKDEEFQERSREYMLPTLRRPVSVHA
ncbi:MAG TPA: SET domain-containing protein-lysine N-methyltransferase [Pyrinomonadaceae bacterium]|nr:SET domain-containing protein-lysine N-methyltransferase [Pyrinomonadaceae bacterium]